MRGAIETRQMTMGEIAAERIDDHRCPAPAPAYGGVERDTTRTIVAAYNSLGKLEASCPWCGSLFTEVPRR